VTLPSALSEEFDDLRHFLLGMTDRMDADPDLGLETVRDMLEGEHALTAEPTGVTYAEVVAGAGVKEVSRCGRPHPTCRYIHPSLHPFRSVRHCSDEIAKDRHRRFLA
jgi:hypothetical protein